MESSVDQHDNHEVLRPGERVRVKSGALAGVEAIIVNSRQPNNRLLLSVSFSQGQVSLVLPRHLVQKV